MIPDVNTHCLLLVDLQNDFMPGGALAVRDGDAVVPVANRLMPRFHHVVATQDLHPEGHISFADSHTGFEIGDVIDVAGMSQVLWPRHCVQDTDGALFSKYLEEDHIDLVAPKGCNEGIDSYSAFYDIGRRNATGLTEQLRSRGIETLWVLGLATDYCVKATVLDALQEGFAVSIIEDGMRAVNLDEDDGAKAIQEMCEAGAKIVHSTEVERLFSVIDRAD